jgi:hypothetical protein
MNFIESKNKMKWKTIPNLLLVILASLPVFPSKFLFSRPSSPSEISLPSFVHSARLSKFIASVSLAGSFPFISHADVSNRATYPPVTAFNSQLLAVSTTDTVEIQHSKQVSPPKALSRAERIFNTALRTRDIAKSKLIDAKIDLTSLKTKVNEKLANKKSLTLNLARVKHQIDSGKTNAKSKIQDLEISLKQLLLDTRDLEKKVIKQESLVNR